MKCKFDNNSPCGMKEYLGVCACDMCKENPIKVCEGSKKKESEVDLKNIDLTEFYNFDTEPVVRKMKPAVSQIVKVGEENKEEKKEEKIVVESVKIGLFSRLKNLLFGR